MSSIDLSGKVVLITGATRNIGRACALSFAAARASVALTSRQGAAGLTETLDAVAGAGGTGEGFALDLGDPDDPGRLGGELLARYGRVDVIVHNAAIRPPTPVGSVTAASWDEVFAVNVRGAMLLTQSLLPAMVDAGWGRLVFLGGISSYIGQADRAAVVSSKLAVVGLARALSFEYSDQGITANIVIPGTINTARGEAALYGPQGDLAARSQHVPMQRLGSPQDVADACLMFSSDLAAYTSGQEFFVTGGRHPLTRHGVG